MVIQALPNSGSVYHSYMDTFSIVLFAVVVENYCFQVVDVGIHGRSRDVGIDGALIDRALSLLSDTRTKSRAPGDHKPMFLRPMKHFPDGRICGRSPKSTSLKSAGSDITAFRRQQCLRRYQSPYILY